MRNGKELLQFPVKKPVIKTISFPKEDFQRIEEAAELNDTTPMAWIRDITYRELNALGLHLIESNEE